MEVLTSTELCAYCGSEQVKDFKFCSSCGKRNKISVRKEQKREKKFTSNIRLLGIYAIFSIILLLVAAFTEETFEVVVFWTFCFAIIDVIFALLQPSVWNLFKLSSIKALPLVSMIAICILSGIIVTYSIDNLNILLFQETYKSMPLFDHLEYPLLYAIITMAVFPALFEELAFRGFVFNNLKVISGENAAIWGSTFLFALVHFSLVSLVWIIPFGLFLAHFRKKYSTLVYGMVGHFVHNATTLLLEHYEVF